MTERVGVGVARHAVTARAVVIDVSLFGACRGSYYTLVPIMTERVCVGVVIFFAANGAGVRGAAFLRAGGRDNCCLSAVGRMTERRRIIISVLRAAFCAGVESVASLRARRWDYIFLPNVVTGCQIDF